MAFTHNKVLEKFLPYNERTISYLVNKIQYSDSSNLKKPNNIDIYFYNTYNRVLNIDDTYKKLLISLEYLEKREFTDTEYNFITHHSYHVENFLLRLTGLVDRCYLYAGTTLNLNPKKIENIGRKKFIIKELDNMSHPNALLLRRLDDLVKKFKDDRNKIVHQENYSRETFIILESLDNEDKEFSKKFKSKINIEEVKSHEICTTKEMFQKSLDCLHSEINDLIDGFDDLYINVIENN